MREINNIGEPIKAPDGTPLGGVKVSIMLVNIDGLPTDALDVVTGERYFPVVISAETSKSDTDDLKTGEFRMPKAWPTSRADRPVFYKCWATAGMKDFLATVMEADAPLKFSVFANSGGEIQPAEASAFKLHVQDTNIHHRFPNAGVLDLFAMVNGTLYWNGQPIGTGAAPNVNPVVADLSNDTAYRIEIEDGILVTVELAVGIGVPVQIIAVDTGNGLSYQITTINGGLATVELEVGTPAQNNIIYDTKTGKSYRIITIDGAISTEEL
jgi:hypothetical protein